MIGSLFSGIGGIELGLESCGLGPVLWQCDNDPHARAVLATHWPSVLRYNDVKEIDETAERPEIICGGFPCQDISLAGKGAGIDGARSGLWSEYARIVRALRPSVVFVENVAALVNRGLDRVLGDLAALGFDAEWDVFRASDVGAPHRRERLFLLAYRNGARWGSGSWDAVRGNSTKAIPGGTPESGRRGGAVPHADGSRREGSLRVEASGTWRPELADFRPRDVADANGIGRELIGRGWLLDGERTPPGDNADRRHRAHRFPPAPAAIAGWSGPQPAIRRGNDGVPGRSHRLRLLGNSVVPQQAAIAWRTLSARIAQARAA